MKPDKTIHNMKFYNCDCMELLKETPDNYYDLAICDPPYGLGNAVVNSGGRFKRYENKNGNWDENTPNKEYFEELFRISKNQIIWGGNYFGLPPNKCFIVWDKLQPEGISFAMAEYAWASFDKVSKIIKLRTQGQAERFHPTQKPVELYQWLLKYFANKNDKIIDTHLGSGSIAIAVNKMKELNLDFTGCEIDSDYFTKSMEIIEKYTRQDKLL